MSIRERLYQPEVVLAGTGHAIERARARGAGAIDPGDLLAGMLLAVSRFGVIDLATASIDLQALGLAFDCAAPDLSLRPGYSPPTTKVFERAARIARGDGSGPILPIHLLVALADPGIPLFARLCERFGLDAATWRRLLAAIDPPDTPAAPQPAVADDDLLSTEEAARLLGLHIQTLRGYIRGGKVAAYRIAGQRSLRIRRQDLSDLLEHLGSEPSRRTVLARGVGPTA